MGEMWPRVKWDKRDKSLYWADCPKPQSHEIFSWLYPSNLTAIIHCRRIRTEEQIFRDIKRDGKGRVESTSNIFASILNRILCGKWGITSAVLCPKAAKSFVFQYWGGKKSSSVEWQRSSGGGVAEKKSSSVAEKGDRVAENREMIFKFEIYLKRRRFGSPRTGPDPTRTGIFFFGRKRVRLGYACSGTPTVYVPTVRFQELSVWILLKND